MLLAGEAVASAALGPLLLPAPVGLVEMWRRGRGGGGRSDYAGLTAYDIRLGLPLASGLLVEALIEGGRVDDAERELEARDLETEIPPGPTNIAAAAANSADVCTFTGPVP